MEYYSKKDRVVLHILFTIMGNIIDKIELNGSEYDIRDTETRDLVDNLEKRVENLEENPNTELPVANEHTLGGVKINEDEGNIGIDGDGYLYIGSAIPNGKPGGVIVKSLNEDEKSIGLTGFRSYTGIKLGDGVSVDEGERLEADIDWIRSELNNSTEDVIIYHEEFYDDGSGDLVPVKYPDISTQPSVLPYKFSGQYVYEQLIPIRKIILGVKIILEVDNPYFLEAILIGDSIHEPTSIEDFSNGVFKFSEEDLTKFNYLKIVYTESLTKGNTGYGYEENPNSKNNKIYYTSSDGNIVTPNSTSFGANIVSNTYSDGIGIIEFDGAITSIGESAFAYCTWITSIEIPNSVTYIEHYAFRGCSNLTSIVISNSLTNIGVEAFRSCSGLTSIEIPNSVTSIGVEAFGWCSGLISIVIPNSVTSIRNNAFYNCSSLASINIPNSVTSIGDYAFYSCKGLKSIEIPNSVTSIGNYAFSTCTGLTSIEIPNSVTSIGKEAFGECYGLTRIVIGNSVTSIGNYAFYNCSLTNIEIPNSVTSIGEGAFYNCKNLTSIVIPNSVTSIGSWAFWNCTGLTSIEIGSGVTSIGNVAFYSCKNLKTVYNFSNLVFAKGSIGYGYVAYYANTIIQIPGGNLVDNDFIFQEEDTTNYLRQYVGTSDNVILPENYKGENYVIFDYVFQNSNITSIVIPSSVTSIGESAFSYCYDLTSIVIGNGVTSIEDYAFYYCENLTSIEIPNSVTSIGRSAFAYCTSITSITIPNSVTSIGSYAFYYCYALKSATIEYGVNSIGESAFGNCTSLTSIEIPNSVTSIGDYAFYGCSSLTSIEIPNSVISIGESAFDNCYDLTNVVIGNSVTSIGTYAFAYCYDLTSIEIPSSVTSIGDGAFQGCRSLTSIHFRDLSSLLNINFGYCYSGSRRNDVRKDLYINGNLITDLVIPPSVTEIKPYTFSYFNFTSITIPKTVQVIGEDAFYDIPEDTILYFEDLETLLKVGDLSQLLEPARKIYIGNEEFLPETLEIPQGITRIGDYACENLGYTDISTIPTSVTSIGNNAFFNSDWYNNLPSGPIYKDGWLLGYKNENPNNVTVEEGTIGIADFVFGSSLSEVVLPGSLRNIGNSTFENCTNLTNITIPEGVVRIGKDAFKGCTNLTKVINRSNLNIVIGSPSFGYVAYYATNYSDFVFNDSGALIEYIGNDTEVVFPVDYKGNSYSIGEGAFKRNTKITKLVFPENSKVDMIESKAFSSCTSITEISFLSNHNLEIGEYAFEGCSGLTTLNIPDSITSIGEGAFQLCTKLTELTLPNTVNTIDYRTFYACSRLNTINFGSNVTTIGEDAFGACVSLTDLTIPSSVTKIEKYAFTDSGIVNLNLGNVSTIGEGAFYYNTNLQSVSIPGSVTSLGNSVFEGCESLVSAETEKLSTGIFRDCFSLQEITLGTSITSIPDNAFSGCSDLGDIDFTRIRSIGKSSFYKCSSFKNVDISNVTSLFESAFSGCSGLESINLGNITAIEQDTFKGCISLESISIPGTVKKIGKSAFKNCNNLSSVYTTSLENWLGITFGDEYSNPINHSKNLYIGDTLLTNIIIPGSITKIGKYAFQNCSSIISLETPETVTEIEEKSFSGCSGLSNITLLAVQKIYKGAFENCTSLESIDLPMSVNMIGENAFEGCTGLSNVYCNSYVVPSGNYGMFAGNSEGRLIHVINSLEESYKSDQYWGVYEESIVGDINKNINKIYYTSSDGNIVTPYLISAFDANIVSNTYSDGIGIIEFDGAVTSIGEKAFYNCSGLTSIVIPDSITSIKESAFYNCSGLTSIIVKEGNTVYDSRNNCNAIIETSSNTLVAGCKNTVIPNSVTCIGEKAFEGCSGLTSIVIPGSVTSIGNTAFFNCYNLQQVYISNLAAWCGIDFGSYDANPLYYTKNLYLNDELLTELTIPAEVTEVKKYAFYNYKGITNVTIPNSVTSIGNSAFNCCTGLTSLEIPNSVTSIGNSAFRGCFGLTSITVADGNAKYDSRDNCNAIIETETNTLIVGCKNTIIPDSVTSIGSYAFYDCSGLTNITIPNSVKSIGDSAFYDCSGLTSITIGNSVTSIGDYAFYYCKNLTSVVIPNSVTSIGNNTFSYCYGLTSITIPNSVISIGEKAFYWCSGLTSIVIGNSVTSIRNLAFQYCSGLKTVYNFSNLVFAKGSSNYGYIARYADKVYNLPGGFIENDFVLGKVNGVNTLVGYLGNATVLTLPTDYNGENYVIAADAFNGNTTITSITIPNSVTSIGEGAFQNCSTLTNIICQASTPPTITSNTFYGVTKTIPVYVPAESIDAYKAAFYWSEFTNIQAIVE